LKFVKVGDKPKLLKLVIIIQSWIREDLYWSESGPCLKTVWKHRLKPK